jgi:hypothetical protein
VDTHVQEILDTLVKEFGEKRVSKKHGTEYFCIPKTQRKNIVRHLVKTLKEEGKDKSYFAQNELKKFIIEASFHPAATKHWNSEMRDGARNTVLRELREIVVEFWPSNFEKAVEVLSPNATEQYNPAIHGRLGKPIDTSIANDEPVPEVIIDEEAARLLGFKK